MSPKVAIVTAVSESAKENDAGSPVGLVTLSTMIRPRETWNLVLVNVHTVVSPSTTVIAAGVPFEQVEEAIILEEGCVPHPDFFRFAAEMLRRYREDDRVMHINGSAAGRNGP